VKKQYTEQQALDIVVAGGVEKKNGKVLYVNNGTNGLKVCGAIDYLMNNCGYTLFVNPSK